MFDPITTALIAGSPGLTGLDREDLPKRLTEAYADIVAARIHFRNASGQASERMVQALSEMSRLAAAHEALVALSPERENRNAAAFVAASAYQACLLGTPPDQRKPSYADGASVAPEVCATLLFLAADAHADAAECAKRIEIPQERAARSDGALLQAIKYLAQGELNAIRAIENPPLQEEEPGERAIEALYLALFQGLKNLSGRLLSRVDIPVAEGGIEPASEKFLRVKDLSVGPLGDVLETGGDVYNLFPGPLHLANLLLAVDRDLIGAATSRVLPPGGVSEDAWWPIIRRMATKRPYLWRNHRQAIDSGYLNIGTSAALSFPTGGGKSTLAELKIATALLRDRKVIFLAPTHALVEQTASGLSRTFDAFEIVGDVDEDNSTVEFVDLPQAIVTTPERCLMLLASQPDAFADLGLVVFDECHLLHPRDAEKSRRSIDAMLAVLNLATAAPDADFLFLSAMMRNTQEVADWLASLTGRACLALDLAWKPTRQVRGCVVYQQSRISELNEIIAAARRDRPNQKDVPAPVERTLTAQPFGFFSLLQTWATRDSNDYTLLPLLPGQHPLATGTYRRNWYLTPNGNHTSTIVAASAASGGLKTLVFVHSIPLVEAAARSFGEFASASVVALTEAERSYYDLATEEMGGPSFCYLQLAADGTFQGGAVGHHGLLLREERLLHESMFKRRDGIDALFATSTLAQGMNFPSEVVIISGDSRFEPGASRLEQLEVHELLNAAGRAGRAGESSQGMVLVVPTKVVPIDGNAGLIGPHWMTLQEVFSQSDQCLDIEDPLTAVLDKIHQGARDGTSSYLLGRLPPVSEGGEEQPLHRLLNSSFAAFRARARGDAEWVESRIAAATAARQEQAAPPEDGWLDNVAGLTGVSIETLRELAALFEDTENLTTITAIDRLWGWLTLDPVKLFEVLRPENVEELFGKQYKDLDSDEKRGNYALPVMRGLLDRWMAGMPLNQIEEAHPYPEMNRCKHARHFVLRLVPDLAFLGGLPAQVMKHRSPDVDIQLPIAISTLGAAVREGCSSPEALAVRVDMGRKISRVATRRRYEALVPYLTAGASDETFDDTLQRVRDAAVLFAFAEGDD